MKVKSLVTAVTAGVVGLLVISLAATLWAQQRKYEMTTETPANVLIPDEVETRLGTLEFFDGVPTEETAAKVWDQLDFQRAVECDDSHHASSVAERLPPGAQRTWTR